MFGCLVAWLVACLFVCSFVCLFVFVRLFVRFNFVLAVPFYWAGRQVSFAEDVSERAWAVISSQYARQLYFSVFFLLLCLACPSPFFSRIPLPAVWSAMCMRVCVFDINPFSLPIDIRRIQFLCRSTRP